ncbi:hypothetical protein [Mariniphaga sp.]|uniref:hypothetical protein n=1 Tax=Mariniphaga sp. TaxID=1954475 RepID=UPI0035620863
MSLILQCSSFVIDSKHKNLIQSPYFDFSWELAVNRYFKDILFVCENEIDLNGRKFFKTLIFNNYRKKTHIINRTCSQHLINKNYADKKIINRAPFFYLFNIPFPNIKYEVENSSLSHEDRYNILISKFRHKTYQNMERYHVRLDIPDTYDIRESQFRPVFQKTFQDIIDLSESYKVYLAEFLNVETKRINTENLIVPYYLLNADELNKINSIQNEIENKIHTEMMEDAQEKENEAYARWESSAIDEMNGEAFEFDPENYWNID